MGKKKHAKNKPAPVDDLSPVKNSGETSKSKKTKPAEDPASVEDTAMQCPSEDKSPVEDLSPVKTSTNPKNPNHRVLETPKKSKKRKQAEDTAMQCSSDQDVEITGSYSSSSSNLVTNNSFLCSYNLSTLRFRFRH
ncbi:unnamed protein product [Arabis nemorensis]|uniref:Uncharacterized protein n=1 Tax=Arabis nemorensis TaxID=586526 RepID=A0A565BIV1_9BRAS|nr:unnamed protein product [Arabis nemorensis]